MTKRKAVWLVLAQVAFVTMILVVEEFRSWDYWQHPSPRLEQQLDDRSSETPRWMTVVKAWITRSPVTAPPRPDEWLQSVDFWPPLSRKALYAAELPVVLSVGWYRHPLSVTQPPPLLPLSLLPGMNRLRLHRRILACEGGLLVAVALFWTLIASVLVRFSGYARWLRFPIWTITAMGVVSALASPWSSSTIEIFGGFCALIAFFGWFAACVATIAFLAWKSAAWVRLRLVQ